MESYYAINTSQSLYHPGVKGMRWGHRRYQNEDGSLTPAGREHYGRMNDSINGMKTGKSAHKISGAITAASYGVNIARNTPAIASVKAGWGAALATGNPVVIGATAAATALGVAGAYGINYATVRAGQHAISGIRNKIHNKKLTKYRAEKFGLKEGTDDYSTRTKIKSIKENPKRDTYTVKSETKGSYFSSEGNGSYTDKSKVTNRRYDGSNVSSKTKRTYYEDNGAKETHVKTYSNGMLIKDKVTQNRQNIKDRINFSKENGIVDPNDNKKHYTIDYKKARRKRNV